MQQSERLQTTIVANQHQIDSVRGASKLTHMRCDALERYMELVLKINGDLTQRVGDTAEARERMRWFVSLLWIIPGYGFTFFSSWWMLRCVFCISSRPSHYFLLLQFLKISLSAEFITNSSCHNCTQDHRRAAYASWSQGPVSWFLVFKAYDTLFFSLDDQCRYNYAGPHIHSRRDACRCDQTWSLSVSLFPILWTASMTLSICLSEIISNHSLLGV